MLPCKPVFVAVINPSPVVGFDSFNKALDSEEQWPPKCKDETSEVNGTVIAVQGANVRETDSILLLFNI